MFCRIEILLHLGVPYNQILLHFGVPHNQILLGFGVPVNQILFYLGVPDNCSSGSGMASTPKFHSLLANQATLHSAGVSRLRFCNQQGYPV